MNPIIESSSVLEKTNEKSSSEANEREETEVPIENKKEDPEHYFCKLCNLTFESGKKKFCHDESLHFCNSPGEIKGESVLYSRICGKSSFTPSDLYNHDLTFHSECLRFICGDCLPAKNFSSQKLLEAHKVVHCCTGEGSSSTRELLNCSICRRSALFKSERDLDNHLLRVHFFSLTRNVNGVSCAEEISPPPECLNDET